MNRLYLFSFYASDQFFRQKYRYTHYIRIIWYTHTIAGGLSTT